MTGVSRPRREKVFRYSIETRDGRLVGVSAAGPIAFAMFRAAVSEFQGQGVALLDRDDVLARTD